MASRRVDDRFDPKRRRVLQAAIGGAVIAGVAAGCRQAPEDAPPASFELTEIPDGGRKIVRIESVPVELRREGNAVTATSMLCTHFSCTVRWDETASIYRCPCHDAEFGPDGAVVRGPATEPLETIPVQVRDGRVLVDLAARADSDGGS